VSLSDGETPKKRLAPWVPGSPRFCGAWCTASVQLTPRFDEDRDTSDVSQGTTIHAALIRPQQSGFLLQTSGV
jgi:hypothetical protein